MTHHRKAHRLLLACRAALLCAVICAAWIVGRGGALGLPLITTAGLAIVISAGLALLWVSDVVIVECEDDT